jgi:hypothetical protein
MAVQLGSGQFTFAVRADWAKVPDEIVLGDVAAVGVDRLNRIYAFNRGEHPVAVFDADGNLLRAKASSPGRTVSMSDRTTRSG